MDQTAQPSQSAQPDAAGAGQAQGDVLTARRGPPEQTAARLSDGRLHAGMAAGAARVTQWLRDQAGRAGRRLPEWRRLVARAAAADAARWVMAKVRPAPGQRLPAPLAAKPAAPRSARSRPALRWLGLALRATGLLAAGLAAAVLVMVVLYRWVNPPLSALMLGQSIAGTEIERTWVPLERISPNLVRAVVLSEDGRFCWHGGVDWPALKEAMAQDRGGSTITMQVVKNLFLWPSRSYVRKAIEIGLAYLVEAVWPKRRIMEIYLNIAEWGDGVFGAEAAAQINFGKSAARLTAQEAALLAVALPNPIERTPGHPSLETSHLASRLLARMAASRASLSCVRSSQLEPRPEPRPQAWPEPRPEAKSGARPEGRPEPRPEARPAPRVARPAQGPDAKSGAWDYLFPGRD